MPARSARLLAALAAFSVLLLCTASSLAQGRTGGGTTPPTPTGGDDYFGDHLVLQSNVHSFILLTDQGKPPTKRLALRGTMLRVTQDRPDAQGTRELLVSVTSTPCVLERDERTGRSVARNDHIHVGVGGLIDCPTDQAEINSLVQLGEVYRIPKTDLDQYGFSRAGWVYGALLVPYKYHFHDRSFSSATTIGPYLGYRMGGLGFNTAFVGSVGLSSLTVANPSANGDTSTIQGFSVAVGIIGDVNKNNNPMTFGVLAGRDWAGSNSSVPYKHEGKTWAAVQIGFSFSK